MLHEPAYHTQRCVEQLTYLAADGQSWTRTLQLRLPQANAEPQRSQSSKCCWIGHARSDDEAWYPVLLGTFKRSRLPDFEVKDCRSVHLSLLTRHQHGIALTRAALITYIQHVDPDFASDRLSGRAKGIYDRLEGATYDLFTSAGSNATATPVATMVSEYLNLSGMLRVSTEESEAKTIQRKAAFLAWVTPFTSTTQYLCWIRGRPGDVVNLTVSYTTADVRDELAVPRKNLRSALCGGRQDDADDLSSGASEGQPASDRQPTRKGLRREARLAIYRSLGMAPLHNAFRVPGSERGASYYFTLQPPDNSIVTYMDWQDGDSFHDDGRLDSSSHAVHFHVSDNQVEAIPEADVRDKDEEPKTVRAYVRSSPRAHKQIAAGALLNLVFIYLAARGRVHTTSGAQWLLLTPAALLAYIADQQRHYYAMATRGQRTVLWAYLIITIGALVTVLFGAPESSEHWGWLAKGFAWMLVISSVLLFMFMAPFGDLYERAMKAQAEVRENRVLAKRLAAERDFALARWRCYEWVNRRYADRVVALGLVITVAVVVVLAITDWGRTLPPVLGGDETAADVTATSHLSYVASEVIGAMVIPWSVLLESLSAPPRGAAPPPHSDPPRTSR
jgi:hypothetical protein